MSFISTVNASFTGYLTFKLLSSLHFSTFKHKLTLHKIVIYYFNFVSDMEIITGQYQLLEKRRSWECICSGGIYQRWKTFCVFSSSCCFKTSCCKKEMKEQNTISLRILRLNYKRNFVKTFFNDQQDPQF